MCAVLISQSRQIMVVDISMSIDGLVCQDNLIEAEIGSQWSEWDMT